MSKIDLITDALEIWQKMCLDNGRASSELGIATKAFAAARELQALKPVAYEHRKIDKQSPKTIIQFTIGSKNPLAEHTLSKTRYALTTTALYALDEVTK